MSTNLPALPVQDPEVPPQLIAEEEVGPALTAEQFLIYLQNHAHSNIVIYEFLYRGVNAAYYDTLRKRITAVESAVRPEESELSAASWRSRQSDIKARLFERLVGLFLTASKPFQAYNRLNTPTNEIDWLVLFGPLQNSVPSFREWGPHFICECKFTQSNVKSEWIGKLNTLLETHGGSVALLISQKVIQGNRGQAAQAKRLAQDLSLLNDRHIISLSFDDLDSCVHGGVNFIQLLNVRFTEFRARINHLKLLLN